MIKQKQMRQHTKVSEVATEMYKFDPYELSCLLYGGEQKFSDYSKAEKLCSMPPVDYNLDREVGLRETLVRGKKIREIIRKHDLPKVDYMNNQAYGNMMNGVLPTNVSHSMFDALLQVLGSEEQLEMYLKPALDEQIVGCYAQTEMGHGSDVQKLETEVLYDPLQETFIVNTPTVKAIKFWPGDLGKMASHAIFHGRLLSNGKDHGVHAFICRIRDEKSHIPLKGLEIGDIGPKYGYGTKDNGYIIFNQFKIPKEALLSRYTTITKDGQVHTIGDPKIAYSVMLQIRSNLLKYGWEGVFKSLTVAGRYANFRTQFKTLPSCENERKLISYKATKDILIPFASLGYSIFFTWSFIKNNASDKIKDLHSLLSCLKAFFMNEVFDGIKSLREVCGAHAYLISSNVSNMMEISNINK